MFQNKLLQPKVQIFFSKFLLTLTIIALDILIYICNKSLFECCGWRDSLQQKLLQLKWEVQLKTYFLCLWLCSPSNIFRAKKHHILCLGPHKVLIFQNACYFWLFVSSFWGRGNLSIFFLNKIFPVILITHFSVPPLASSPHPPVQQFLCWKQCYGALSSGCDKPLVYTLATFFLYGTASLSSCISVLHFSLLTAYYYIDARISYLNWCRVLKT